MGKSARSFVSLWYDDIRARFCYSIESAEDQPNQNYWWVLEYSSTLVLVSSFLSIIVTTSGTSNKKRLE